MAADPRIITTTDELAAFCELAKQQPYVTLDTEFLRAGRARGCITVDGLGMLLHQAAPGFERWFGVRPEVDEPLRAAVLG